MLHRALVLACLLCGVAVGAQPLQRPPVLPVPPVSHPCPQADGVTLVNGQEECLVIQTTTSMQMRNSASDKVGRTGKAAKSAPKLLVYLHGDSSRGGSFDRHFKYFTPLASADTVFVGLIRPGYVDGKKNASSGDRMGGGDNYTAHNVDAVANALQALKTQYATRRLVVVGYSGGAATAGVILGRHPALIDDAVLIACPCDLAIRRLGKSNQNRRSISPSEVADQVFKTVHVTALTGDMDVNTAPNQVTGYIETLQKRGVKAQYVEVKKATHDSGILGTALLRNTVVQHLSRP